MRSKSASAPWTSTWTLSSWPSGKKSRLWSVVKATMSPIVGALGTPVKMSAPASQYTNAGMMLKIVPTIMKNQRPTMLWRICSAASLALATPEALDRGRLLAEGLGQQDAADAERLLGDGGHVGQRSSGSRC